MKGKVLVAQFCLTLCDPKDCSLLTSSVHGILQARILESVAIPFMEPHSSTLAWKIPWTEEPGGLQSMGSLGVGHNWVNSVLLFTFVHWRRKWQPTPVFLLGECQGWGSLVAALYGVAQSRTWLKWLSSSSSSHSLLQGICPTQGWNPSLLHWRQILYCQSHQGSPL